MPLFIIDHHKTNHTHYDKAILFIYALALLFMTGTAAGSGAIQVQYLQDSSDSEDIFIDLNTDITNSASLFASLGNTRSPASASDLDLDYWNIGLGLRLTNKFDIEFEVGNFGQGNDINVDTIDVRLRWSSDNWSFSLKPQFDEIEVLTTFNNLSRIRDIESTGIGASISYYGMENWEYSLSYDAYDYSTDLRILNILRVVNRISSKAIIVAYGLKDNIISADITYLFPKTDITVGYARSQSAVDQTKYNVGSISSTFYHLAPFKFGIEAGAVGDDVDNASYYGGVTAGYTW